MGYHTQYKLETKPDDLYTRERILVSLSKISGYLGNGLRHLVVEGGTQNWKWYEHRDELERVSALNPDVLIALMGDGEDSLDFWIEYYKGGQSESYKVALVYPKNPFDPEETEPRVNIGSGCSLNTISR